MIEFLCATILAKVIDVHDGDTLTARDHGKNFKVRLAMIDCPEKNQAFGSQATRFTRKSALGKIVRIEESGHDRYGRTIGVVWLPNGKCLNHELLRRGFAWHYKKYSSDESCHQLETEAISQKTGIWRVAQPIAPWAFRSRNR